MFYFEVVAKTERSFLRQFSNIEANIPAVNPQNAEPIPNIVNPDADKRMVISAGSLSLSSSKAVFKLLPIVPKRASPARARTNSFGKAKNKVTIVAPKIPINNQQIPAKMVDL